MYQNVRQQSIGHALWWSHRSARHIKDVCERNTSERTDFGKLTISNSTSPIPQQRGSGNLLFVNCYSYKSPFSIATEFLNLFECLKEIHQYAGGILWNIMIQLWDKPATLNTVMTCHLTFMTYGTFLIEQHSYALNLLPCEWHTDRRVGCFFRQAGPTLNAALTCFCPLGIFSCTGRLWSSAACCGFPPSPWNNFEQWAQTGPCCTWSWGIRVRKSTPRCPT
jgi:hypothetical protein